MSDDKTNELATQEQPVLLTGMAKRKAVIVPHQFKKGQSGNPKGRPPRDELERAISALLHTAVPDAWLCGKYLEPLRGQGYTWMEIMVLRQASIAIQPGGKGTAQTTAFNALIDRAVGPVMRNVKVEHTHAVVELTDEERRARIKALADKATSLPIIDAEFTDIGTEPRDVE